MLKLNVTFKTTLTGVQNNSNTTLVKVKCFLSGGIRTLITNSNTTLVKVKSTASFATLWNLFYSNTTLVKVKYTI